jgi:hypothetical protein
MVQSLTYHLFSKADANVYAVLDAASIPNLLGALQEHKPKHERLFMGELEPGMAEVIPYLVQLDPDADFTNWVLEKGWGKHWGVYAVSEANIRAMRMHFRSFLTVYDPDDKPLYFRYYDPRVLRVYLPTCNAGELKTVFGPVEYYLLEDRDPSVALRFANVSGKLLQDKIALQGV